MSGSLAQRNAWVERVLGVRTTAAGLADGDTRAAGVRLAQAMMGWNAARIHVGGQIERLQDAIVSAAEGDEQFADIVDGVGNLDEVMSRLDDSLGETLGAIRATPDPGEKAALIRQARDAVARLQVHVTSDPLLADIDANGFLPLDIKPRLTAAFSVLLAAL